MPSPTPAARSDARTVVVHRALVVGLSAAAVALFACAKSLDDLAPFPCSSHEDCPSSFVCVTGTGCVKPGSAVSTPFPCHHDGTCPSGLTCVADVGCTATPERYVPFPCPPSIGCPAGMQCLRGIGCMDDPLKRAPFPCPTDGSSCPSGLACIGGKCSVPTVDTLCSGSGSSVSCSLGSLACVAGACEHACTADRECDSNRRCADNACLATCKSKSECASGLNCVDTYRGYSVCVAGDSTFAACVGAKLTSCAPPATLTCPDSSVTCPDGTCPAHSTCQPMNRCRCETGYTPVYCDGTPCPNGSCVGPSWVCKPPVPTQPTCAGDPFDWEGTCHCADGTNVSVSCGMTHGSCETLCRNAAGTK